MSVNAAGTTLASRDVVDEALRVSIACCLATIGVGWIAEVAGLLDAGAVAGAAALQAVFLTVALTRLNEDTAPSVLGTANRITIARSSLVALLGAFAVDPPTESLVLWGLVVAAIGALVLDGLDGAAARREGNPSRFGAWLDQEIDALFVTLLAAFVWRSGEAGAWILLAGAWRYVFLALVALVPRLRGDLPFSQRRRVVCVVQLGVLVGCVAPIIEPPLSTALAALSLVVLSTSFVVDLAHLWRASTIHGTTVSPGRSPARTTAR